MKNLTINSKVIVVTLLIIIIPSIIKSQTPCFNCAGNNNTANEGSFATGEYNTASGDFSFSAGYNNTSSQSYSIAIGYENTASGFGAISIGRLSQSYGNYSLALGAECRTNTMSYAFGQNANASGPSSLAIGRNVQSSASNSITIGCSSSASVLNNSIDNSLIVGFDGTQPILYVGKPMGEEYGKVGIGTTDPRTELEVDGVMTCSGFAMPTQNMHNGYVLTCNEFGYADWAPGASSLWTKVGATENIYRPSGFVGIGTDFPTARLQLGGQWTFNDRSGSFKSIGYNTTYTYERYYRMETGPASMISFDNDGAVAIRLSSEGIGGEPIESFTPGLFVSPEGMIGVGTEHPSAQLHLTENAFIGTHVVPMEEYGLYVEKGIYAKVVKVEHPPEWSDFVFSEGYNLKSLKEVEDFINENGHLPDIPNTEEVEENGIDLGSMDAKLLQKIEELTLYVIEQNRQLKKQQAELEELRILINSNQ